MPTIDLSLAIRGTTIPLDYGYGLFSALCRVVPRLHGDRRVGVHPIRGMRLAAAAADARARSRGCGSGCPRRRSRRTWPWPARGLDLEGGLPIGRASPGSSRSGRRRACRLGW